MTIQVKSAHRVLELLEFFAELRRPAGVGEVAQSLGYPQSSTSVLLKSLAEAGYFDHDARTGHYAPSVRIALATAWIPEHIYSERSLLRLMEHVQSQTGHTVMIGIRAGMHVRYLHVLQATRDGRFHAKSGALRPLFHSAAGKMLLTTMAERDVAALLRNANAVAKDPAVQLEFSAVCRGIESARRSGYAMSTGTSMRGAAALATLIPVATGRDPMTLSVGGPLQEIQQHKGRLASVLAEAVNPIGKMVQQ